MTKRYFKFNGKSSEDFNMIITSPFAPNSPEQDLAMTSVAGRSGDIIFSNDRNKNGSLTYSGYIDLSQKNVTRYSTLSGIKTDISKWLNSESKYGYLVDSLDKLYFYEAICIKGVEFQWVRKTLAKFKIEFDVKPFKKRQESQNFLVADNGRGITNDEPFNSLPIFKITGTGAINLKVNDTSYQLSEIGGTSYINSETERIYDDKGLKNDIAIFVDHEYPFLKTGRNIISWDNKSAKVEVKINARALI